MKTCTKCKQTKSFDQFNKNSARKDGFQSVCRQCSKEYYKSYYDTSSKERDRLNVKNRINRDIIRYEVQKRKEVPCADCKVSYPYYVMDFDHQGDKVLEVSIMVVRNYSLGSILREISKCDVVCSNCHRIRAHRHLDGYESQIT